MAAKSKHTPFFGDLERKPLLTVAMFASLFSAVKLHPSIDPGKVHEIPVFKLGTKDSTGYTTVDFIGSGKHYPALQIRPTELLATTVDQNMINVDHDRIYFQIFVSSDGTSRVYAKYGQIIGSRIIADFSAVETRRFFKSIEGYPALPRRKRAS